ncbi:hypothetical protein A2U01_0003400, partial [Trifolium medium]|nr:hypothetical protein [Trifolium medium]
WIKNKTDEEVKEFASAGSRIKLMKRSKN